MYRSQAIYWQYSCDTVAMHGVMAILVALFIPCEHETAAQEAR